MTLLIHQFGRQAVSEEDIIGGWFGDFPSRDAALRSVCPARRFSPCTRPWLIRICARRVRDESIGPCFRPQISVWNRSLLFQTYTNALGTLALGCALLR